MSPLLNSIILFIHSTKNIIACVFSLGGLTLFFTETIYENWVWIVLGLYAIGYRITPAPPQIVHSYTGMLSSSELLLSLNTLLRNVEKKIPRELLTPVLQIKLELENIITQFSELKKDVHSHLIIQQTIVDYLPNILDTYIKIPHMYRKIHMPHGNDTTTKIAVEQLELLLAQTQKTSEMISNRNIIALKAHLRFLKTKFANSN
jgi:hypothetical protein